MNTVKEMLSPVESEIINLEKKIKDFELKKQRALKKAALEIVKIMKAMGLEISDLLKYGNFTNISANKKNNEVTGIKVGKRKIVNDGRSKVKAKYYDPISKNSWSGRGKDPKWLIEFESSGRSRDEIKV